MGNNKAEQTTLLLRQLATEVRAARARRGMTRKILARDSALSERYLAQLESGTANPSLEVLDKIARAMDITVADLILAIGGSDLPEAQLLVLIDRLPAAALPRLQQALEHRLHPDISEAVSVNMGHARARRIALIGLRGAGKSTLGRQLAAQLEVPFIELNRLVEAEYGASIGEILALSGQPTFRRLERSCLQAVIDQYDTAVIATGGGLVADPQSFKLLRDRAHTVWLKANPDEHMARVIAQGDLRPMAKNTEAMADLKAILSAREPLYAQALGVIDTAGQAPQQSAAGLFEHVNKLFEQLAARPEAPPNRS